MRLLEYQSRAPHGELGFLEKPLMRTGFWDSREPQKDPFTVTDRLCRPRQGPSS